MDMFPGSSETGWPSFLECVSIPEWQFDEDLLKWLMYELEKIELNNPGSSVDSTLAQLLRQGHSQAMRFQTEAVERYFGSDFFVARAAQESAREG